MTSQSSLGEMDCAHTVLEWRGKRTHKVNPAYYCVKCNHEMSIKDMKIFYIKGGKL